GGPARFRATPPEPRCAGKAGARSGTTRPTASAVTWTTMRPTRGSEGECRLALEAEGMDATCLDGVTLRSCPRSSRFRANGCDSDTKSDWISDAEGWPSPVEGVRLEIV